MRYPVWRGPSPAYQGWRRQHPWQYALGLGVPVGAVVGFVVSQTWLAVLIGAVATGALCLIASAYLRRVDLG